MDKINTGDIVRFAPDEDVVGERCLDHFGDIAMLVTESEGDIVCTEPLDREQLNIRFRNYGPICFARRRFVKDHYLTAVWKRKH